MERSVEDKIVDGAGDCESMDDLLSYVHSAEFVALCEELEAGWDMEASAIGDA